MDIQDVRVNNLQGLLDKHKTQKRLAEALGVEPAYLNQLLRKRRPITEKTARKLEKALKMPPRMLDLGRLTDYSVPDVYTLENAPPCNDADYHLAINGNEFADYRAGTRMIVSTWNVERRERGGFAVIRPSGQSLAIICLALNPGSETIQFAQLIGGKPMTHQDFVHSENDVEILGAIVDVAHDPRFEEF